LGLFSHTRARQGKGEGAATGGLGPLVNHLSNTNNTKKEKGKERKHTTKGAPTRKKAKRGPPCGRGKNFRCEPKRKALEAIDTHS